MSVNICCSVYFPFSDIQQVESHLKSRKQEVRDPMIGQLQQMIDNVQSTNDQLAINVTASVRTEVQHQLQMMVVKYVSPLQTFMALMVGLQCFFCVQGGLCLGHKGCHTKGFLYITIG